MSRTDLPDPESLSVTTIDQRRNELGLSKQEFSRRADKDEQRWADILRRDYDPKLSTIKDFIEVLHDADPDGPRTQRGRPASCLADGGED